MYLLDFLLFSFFVVFCRAEEELSGSKAFVTKLLGDIELEKNQRTDRDDLDRKVQELQVCVIAMFPFS